MVPHILHYGKIAEVDVTLGGGGRGETKEHVHEKTYFHLQREHFCLQTNCGCPAQTAHGHFTTPLVQTTALQVQIRSFRTQQAGEYFWAETSHPHYDNLAFATTWQSPSLHKAWATWVGKSSQLIFGWRWLPQHKCMYLKQWQPVSSLSLCTVHFPSFPIILTQSQQSKPLIGYIWGKKKSKQNIITSFKIPPVTIPSGFFILGAYWHPSLA